jgi:acyl-CoA synthetase (AMP-forming)/AMP-acid ligase II
MVLCFSRQVYGMSESTGPHSINNITKGYQLNSAGKPVPGCITKIANPDKDGNGEVLLLCVSFFFRMYFHGLLLFVTRKDSDGRTACLYGLLE